MVLKATVKIDSKVAADKIRKSLKQRIIDSGVLEAIANHVIKQIRAKNFTALKDTTIEWRRRIASTNPTHPKYSAQKSNLTLTGEFLDSIVSEIIKKDLLVKIYPTGEHPGYFTKKGSVTPKKAVSNQEILERQLSLGRNPLKITGTVRREIIEIIKKKL